jgi:hypothetical protein
MLATLTLAPQRAEQLLTRAREVLQARWPVILATLALLAGAFVLLLGITGLTGATHGRVGRVSRRLRRIIAH